MKKPACYPSSTWAELKDAAAKIKAVGGDVYGFGLQGKEIETDVYYYYAMWSQGTEILNADGTSGLGSHPAHWKPPISTSR